MLGKPITVTNVSTTPDTDSVVGGVGTLASTLVAHHHNATGLVTALAPKAESGSSAIVKSGKTIISEFRKVKQLEKEITTYTASYGKTFTRQHDVGKHIKDLLSRILNFSKGGKHEILDELAEDKHLGTFESHDGHLVHIAKFIRRLEDKEGTKNIPDEEGFVIAEEQDAQEARKAAPPAPAPAPTPTPAPKHEPMPDFMRWP